MSDLLPVPIPDGPLAPEGVGWLLSEFLKSVEGGPPYVHTFRPSEPLYDADGFPYWPLEPHFTLEETAMADLETPEGRVEAFLEALKAADGGWVRSVGEPRGVAGVPGPDGAYFELLPEDLRALLEKARAAGDD